ncbi:hypothetical protein CAPTEDRAFT_223453 [Capitella teleta]|uniref:Uncharacterized protein n=1 Tax=Capitella teleta TaxID=283909 RepID=R7VF83_CAPTE|nr:hypothetical protein CAPTEDRAFT_223453 [Capitella teleta]|eukprot:ELU14330.1 hypothetical protein CAPTEDRAFT_223453 [Capitella teleta]
MTENDKFLVRFAQCLASNEKKYRDRAVVKLKKWLQTKCKGDMLDEQLMKIWKGLHYCMWMSDKPLVQEELADRLSKLVHVMETPELTLRFVESFFWTEAREWHGTDVFRLDKFMMLIRLYWRESLMFLKQNSWEMSSSLIDLLSRTYISVEEDRVSDGLRFFMADIFWEELERVGAEELSEEQVAAFMRPYCVVICKTENKMLQQHVMKNIFEPPLEWAKEDLALDEFLGDEEEEAEEDEEEEEEEEEEIDEDNEVDEEEEGETEELEEIHRCAARTVPV